MNAGKSKHPVGTHIKITSVSDPEDKDLIGLTGTLTHPFGFPASYVGVYLDQKGIYKGDICNLKRSDKFEVLSDLVEGEKK